MRLCLLMLFFFLISIYVNSQTISIKGSVKSENEPIAFARLQIFDLNVGTETDTSGNFHFPRLVTKKSEQEWIIQCSAIGFMPQKRSIRLKSILNDTTIIINFELFPTEIADVVITGTMKESSRLDSPIPVEVYTNLFFQKTNNANVFESLQMVNGVQPTLNCTVCNTGDIHINGMEGPYTMITIDGMPIVSGLSTVYGLSGIPNSMIERVEVIKGPAGALYGSEAVGGLVNIITKNPAQAPKFYFNTWVSSYLETNLDLATALKISKKVHTLFSMNTFWFNSRWDKNQDGFTDLTLQKRTSFFNKWTIQRKDQREATFALRYFTENRFGGEMNWQTEHRGGDEIYGESIYTNRFEAFGTYQFPIKNEKIKLQGSFNWHDQNSVYGDVAYLGKQSIGFAQLLWDKKIARHDLLFGTSFRATYYDDNTSATFDSVAGNQPSLVTLPGVFVQDEIKLGAKWKVLAGMRYDFHIIHKSIFSPRISFQFRPYANTTFRLMGGNGFRVVNVFTEDHAALTGSRTVVFRENLDPERSWNVNLNFHQLISFSKGYFVLDASAFYTHFQNKIIADYLTDPNAVIYQNLKGYAVSRGVSLNTEYHFSFPVKIQAGGTIMQVFQTETDDEGNVIKRPQIHTPAFSGTFVITYKLHRIKTNFDVNGQVYSPMHLPVLENDFRPSRSPWFSWLNFQITKSFKKGVEVYGGGKNMLNFFPKDPLMRPFDPFDRRVDDNNPYGYTFDTAYNFAPLQTRHYFIGIRWTLNGKSE